MRYLVVVLLTLCQFTAFPFFSIVAANTVRQQEESATRADFYSQASHVTTIYKTEM